jgi:hypothetical protein
MYGDQPSWRAVSALQRVVLLKKLLHVRLNTNEARSGDRNGTTDMELIVSAARERVWVSHFQPRIESGVINAGMCFVARLLMLSE